MAQRGGNRKHPADCNCGNCPKVGRPKANRPVDGNIARRIKAKVKAEEKWIRCIELASEKAEATKNTADLARLLIYLDNRDLGNPTDTVNHLHDKPSEVSMTLNLADLIQKARKRVTA